MGTFGLKDIVLSGIKIISASLLMGIVAKLTNQLLQSYVSANLALLVPIGIGAGIYFLLILYMKIKVVDTIIDAIKGRLGRAEG